jgi:hypothetical protein
MSDINTDLENANVFVDAKSYRERINKINNELQTQRILIIVMFLLTWGNMCMYAWMNS